MKRTMQMRTGNVTGAGKTFKGKTPIVETPINARKVKEPMFSFPAPMTPLLAVCFKRAGLPTPF